MVKKQIRSKKSKETTVVRSSDHRSHYVTGVIPQWTDDDLRLHFYNEVLEGHDGPYYVSTTQIIMPKTSLQRLIETLRGAALSEEKRSRTQISNLPLEIAMAVDREVFDLEKKGEKKKKVQKIRRK